MIKNKSKMKSNLLIYFLLISLVDEFKTAESVICKYYPSGQSLNIGNNPLLTFGEDTACPYSSQYCCTERATTATDACCGPKFEWYFLTIPIIFVILIILAVAVIFLFCKLSKIHKMQIKPENNYGKSNSTLDLSNSDMGPEISGSTFELVNKDPVYEIETKTDTPILVLPKKVHKHVLNKQVTTQQESRPQSQYLSRVPSPNEQSNS